MNVVPRKMLKEKLLIFFTFPRYGNGVLETTFCIKIKFGLAGAKMVKIGLVSLGGTLTGAIGRHND